MRWAHGFVQVLRAEAEAEEGKLFNSACFSQAMHIYIYILVPYNSEVFTNGR